MRANWVTIDSTDEYVLIRDVGPWDVHMSVTNDAEAVVKALVATGHLGTRKLFYIDSDGRTDRLLVENGEFAGFKREGLPKRQPRDYIADPDRLIVKATPHDDNAFWNAFRKRNPDWRGD